MGISDEEFLRFVSRCRNLPPAQGVYVQTDYITNLFLTVLDYRSTAESVRQALATYRSRWWDQIRSLQDLKRFLARYPDTAEGNLQAGSDLWGFRAARRVHELRGLVRFFEAKGVVTQELLTHWARASSYRDFMGQVRGLSLQVYEALLVRHGFGPLKPAAHLSRFVSGTLGRAVPENEVIEVVERTAQKLGWTARDLERRIYEYERC